MTDKNTNEAKAAAPSKAEVGQAQREGVLDRVREGATTQDIDSLPGEEPKADLYVGKEEIMQWAHYIDFDIDGLKAALSDKAANQIPDNKVAGLLGLERGGKNRTAFVEVYMDRLRKANPGLKSPYEVTNAGPPYTNDVSNITKL